MPQMDKMNTYKDKRANEYTTIALCQHFEMTHYTSIFPDIYVNEDFHLTRFETFIQKSHYNTSF